MKNHTPKYPEEFLRLPTGIENITPNTSFEIKEDLGYWEADGCSHSSLKHLGIQCLSITEVLQTGMKAKSAKSSIPRIYTPLWNMEDFILSFSLEVWSHEDGEKLEKRGRVLYFSQSGWPAIMAHYQFIWHKDEKKYKLAIIPFSWTVNNIERIRAVFLC